LLLVGNRCNYIQIDNEILVKGLHRVSYDVSSIGTPGCPLRRLSDLEVGNRDIVEMQLYQFVSDVVSASIVIMVKVLDV
jgi:hypothetical protein